jgi:hypothetical protein
MADNSQDDRDRPDRELSEANDQFMAQLYRQTRVGIWLGPRNHKLVLGPYNAMQLGSIYRYILLAFFGGCPGLIRKLEPRWARGSTGAAQRSRVRVRAVVRRLVRG